MKTLNNYFYYLCMHYFDHYQMVSGLMNLIFYWSKTRDLLTGMYTLRWHEKVTQIGCSVVFNHHNNRILACIRIHICIPVILFAKGIMKLKLSPYFICTIIIKVIQVIHRLLWFILKDKRSAVGDLTQNWFFLPDNVPGTKYIHIPHWTGGNKQGANRQVGDKSEQ